MPEPEKGDKVSWNWGGGAPGGKVAEKKTSGEVAIKSKRGNTIKKNASPDNPAVHVERSGNDVVKKASELNIEKKAGSGGGDKKRKSEGKSAEGDDDLVKNEEGKDVKASGKKQKTEEKMEVNGEKKGKGRPKKGEAGAKKEKKAPTPRSTEGVGSRTRSRA